MNDLRKSLQLGFGVYSWLHLVDLVWRTTEMVQPVTIPFSTSAMTLSPLQLRIEAASHQNSRWWFPVYVLGVLKFWIFFFRILYCWSYTKFMSFLRQARDWFLISKLYSNEHTWALAIHGLYKRVLNNKRWSVQPRKWWDKKCTGYVGDFIFLKQGDLYL